MWKAVAKAVLWMEMSKIESDQISLKLLKVSLPERINQFSVMILSQAGEAGVSLKLNSEQIIHEDFYGDPLRINQILINLLSNVVKFTANAFAEDVLRSREAGMNAHVAKPIDLEVLMDTLWKVMKAPNLGET